ncbi:response regulator [Myxococcota bacterium]|nr:response regulator [Myxococcota bacterium]MBU1381313.1 response regulator [Myxococcota bacterium]MBU1495690.1 response regulator [Myxococcota bacterium]
MSPTVTHESILQLIISLTQIREEDNIIESFLNEWNRLLPSAKLAFLKPGSEVGVNSLLVSTEAYTFGSLDILGGIDDIATEVIILLSKSARLLAFILESRMNESFLVDGQKELQKSVRSKSQELHKVEDAYKELTDSISDVFIAMDRDFNITYWNKAAVALTEVTSAEIIGESIWNVFGMLRGSVFEQSLKDTRATWKKSNFDMEYEVNGRKYYFQVIAYPFRQGLSLIARDITSRIFERKQEIQEQQKKINEQKIESLAIMAGGIAHDFNNLLNVVIGHSSLLLNDMSPDDPIFSDLQAIEQAARTAANLSRQMLDYSGRGKIQNNIIEINSYLRDLKSVLTLSVPEGISFRVKTARSQTHVEGDSNQIRQLITNLVVNAIESIEKVGNIEISTGVSEYSDDDISSSYVNDNLKPGVYVFIKVTDSGCGIEKGDLPRIFDPFFSTKFTGRGLGLSAVMGIVRGHKGGIIVTSEPGHGSEFTILLPKKESPAGTMKETQKIPYSFVNRGSILFVDDENSVRRAGEKMLKRLGFNVFSASNGLEAIEVFKNHSNEISVIILDVAMPEMDGIETMIEIKKLNSQVPILLSSGYSDPDNIRIADGASAFLPKPYNFSQLTDTLKKVLNGG